jgi:arsenate reductase
MTDRIYNVLFLCTGNSARSILAEAILSQRGIGRFQAYSAGSYPKGAVHPAAIALLKELDFDTESFRSKSWDEFSGADAPRLDFVFTVCDNAAGEVCPIWPGQPMTAHWGIEDPAAVEGAGQGQAFWNAYQQLQRRIQLFLALPIGTSTNSACRTG